MGSVVKNAAADALLQELYVELRRLARARVSRVPGSQNLQATELVHEVYLRFAKNKQAGWDNRAMFFGAAARAMRDIVIEHARRQRAQKRGGDMQRVDETITLADGNNTHEHAEDILALHDALERMQKEHPRKAEIVLLRYFCGFTNEQIADMLDVTARTIEREWRFARAWLHEALGGEDAAGA